MSYSFLAAPIAGLLLCGACKKDPATAGESAPPDQTATTHEAASGDKAAATSADRPPPPARKEAAPSEKTSSIEWIRDEGEALRRSKELGRPLLIDFSAKWCAPCQEMEEKTFPDPKVAALIAGKLVALKVDITEMTSANEAIMTKYGVRELPVILVRSPTGETLQRWAEFVPAGEFANKLAELVR